MLLLGTSVMSVLGLDAEPVRVYKPVQPTQKTTTEVTEKGETATPTGTHLDINRDVFVEADGASSDKTAKKNGYRC